MPINLPADLKERRARLRLFRSVNIGTAAFRQFLHHYGSAEKTLASLPQFYRGKKITFISEDEILAEWQALEKLGGKFLFYGLDDYPKEMAKLGDAPPILSVLGNIDLLHRPTVAIVGARNASINGRKLAAQLADDLSMKDYSIATGFARGIDSAAHEAALKNAAAIAVFAGGVDYVYPPENQSLYEETLRYGTIISEVKLGYQPIARSFPKRNRIISALSQAVIIVEAAQGSGSLITAQYALRHDKILCALPGSPLDGRAQGTNNLIKEGAHLIENAEDVIKLLESPTALYEQVEDGFDWVPLELDFESDSLDKTMVLVLDGLSASPSLADDIIRHIEMPAGVINAALLLLELEGKIERMPGNRFARIEMT